MYYCLYMKSILISIYSVPSPNMPAKSFNAFNVNKVCCQIGFKNKRQLDTRGNNLSLVLYKILIIKNNKEQTQSNLITFDRPNRYSTSPKRIFNNFILKSLKLK